VPHAEREKWPGGKREKEGLTKLLFWSLAEEEKKPRRRLVNSLVRMGKQESLGWGRVWSLRRGDGKGGKRKRQKETAGVIPVAIA